jgi:putative addiction module CopG family antidote
MNVNLPAELEEFLHRKVQAGVYPSANEAISDAVRQMSEQERDWNEDGPELKEFLLQAVRGGHRPLRLEDLEAMERRVLARGE